MSDHSAVLRCFSESTTLALGFLGSEYGCERSEGFSLFGGYPGPESIRKADFSNIPGIFSYVVRYSSASAVLDMSYGDRELMVEAAIIYPKYGLRFAPWELVSAGKISAEISSLGGASWVLAEDHMKNVIEDFATALRPHWIFLSNPPQEVIDRALVQRGERMRFAQEAQRLKDRESACIQASRAFHDGDHPKAAALLQPFAADEGLPKSSRALYQLALRNAANAHHDFRENH